MGSDRIFFSFCSLQNLPRQKNLCMRAGERVMRTIFEFRDYPPGKAASFPRLPRFQFMMRRAKSLTVRRIEGCATICDLDDMVRIQLVTRLCLGASIAMCIHGLTSVASSG